MAPALPPAELCVCRGSLPPAILSCSPMAIEGPLKTQTLLRALWGPPSGVTGTPWPNQLPRHPHAWGQADPLSWTRLTLAGPLLSLLLRTQPLIPIGTGFPRPESVAPETPLPSGIYCAPIYTASRAGMAAPAAQTATAPARQAHGSLLVPDDGAPEVLLTHSPFSISLARGPLFTVKSTPFPSSGTERAPWVHCGSVPAGKLPKAVVDLLVKSCHRNQEQETQGPRADRPRGRLPCVARLVAWVLLGPPVPSRG